MCLQPAERKVSTPEQIHKYRKSFKEQCGVTINHYGVANDPKPSKEHTYGVATEKSEGAGRIMKAGNKEGVNDFINNLKESKYDSLKRYLCPHTVNPSPNPLLATITSQARQPSSSSSTAWPLK